MSFARSSFVHDLPMLHVSGVGGAGTGLGVTVGGGGGGATAIGGAVVVNFWASTEAKTLRMTARLPLDVSVLRFGFLVVRGDLRVAGAGGKSRRDGCCIGACCC